MSMNDSVSINIQIIFGNIKYSFYLCFMKLYFDKDNKWCLTMEDENDPRKKHWMAIPPTNDDRTDIISDGESFLKKDGYCYGFKGIIIRNGSPTAELIE
jgi:hypothetical protein